MPVISQRGSQCCLEGEELRIIRAKDKTLGEGKLSFSVSLTNLNLRAPLAHSTFLED